MASIFGFSLQFGQQTMEKIYVPAWQLLAAYSHQQLMDETSQQVTVVVAWETTSKNHTLDLDI